MPLVNKHTDDRREMVEWVVDSPVRCYKVITVKRDCILGDHYHNIKTETFFLLKGEGEFTAVYPDGRGLSQPIKSGFHTVVGPEIRHSFSLKKGSILLEAATHPYNEADEIK